MQSLTDGSLLTRRGSAHDNRLPARFINQEHIILVDQLFLAMYIFQDLECTIDVQMSTVLQLNQNIEN